MTKTEAIKDLKKIALALRRNNRDEVTANIILSLPLDYMKKTHDPMHDNYAICKVILDVLIGRIFEIDIHK